MARGLMAIKPMPCITNQGYLRSNFFVFNVLVYKKKKKKDSWQLSLLNPELSSSSSTLLFFINHDLFLIFWQTIMSVCVKKVSHNLWTASVHSVIYYVSKDIQGRFQQQKDKFLSFFLLYEHESLLKGHSWMDSFCICLMQEPRCKCCKLKL